MEQKAKPGPKPDQRLRMYAERFGIDLCRSWGRRALNPRIVAQLEACQSDEARRLIMGVSR